MGRETKNAMANFKPHGKQSGELVQEKKIRLLMQKANNNDTTQQTLLYFRGSRVPDTLRMLHL